MVGLPHAAPLKLSADVVAGTTPSRARAVPNPKHCLSQLSQYDVSGDESAAGSGDLRRGEPVVG
eukprot:2487950-Alexandrium_andersonii.AAC.1